MSRWFKDIPFSEPPEHFTKEPRSDENEKAIRKSYSKFDDSELFNITLYFTSGLKVEYGKQSKETVIELLHRKMNNCSSGLIDKTDLVGGSLIDYTRVEYIDVKVVSGDKE